MDSVICLKEREIIYRNNSTFIEILKGVGIFEEVNVATGFSGSILTEILSKFDTSTQVKAQMAENN